MTLTCYFSQTKPRDPLIPYINHHGPASTYGLETVDLSELQQRRLQLCEKHCLKIIADLKRAGRRRIQYLREEVGTKFV